MRFIPIVFLFSIVAIGCSRGPEYYTNPYEDPGSQREYSEWTMEADEKRARSNVFIRGERTWMQTYQQREPIFRGYLKDVNQANQRLQRLRAKEAAIRLRDFQESLSTFTTVDTRKGSKARRVKGKQTEFFSKKQASDASRYKAFLRTRKDLCKLLSPEKKQEKGCPISN